MSSHDLLNHSIVKWKMLSEISLEGYLYKILTLDLADSCALCEEYNAKISCGKCPVKIFTNIARCRNKEFTAIEDFFDTIGSNPLELPKNRQKELHTQFSQEL